MPSSIDIVRSADNDVIIMDDMSEKISVLERDVSVLKTDVSVLKTDVSVLKTDVSVLKTDVSVLKTDVAVLKADVAVLKTDVAVIRSNYASKADLAMLEAALLKWGFGGFVALAGIIVGAAKFIR